MTITSKYPGKCIVCGGRIHVGDQIEWRKGEGSSHTACAVGGSAPVQNDPVRWRAPSKPRAPSFPRTAPEVGAVLINGRRTGRHDMRNEPGRVVHAPKVAGGGGPDGHYWTVIVSRMSAPCEDNGQYDWLEQTWVRPATETESADLVAAAARKAFAALSQAFAGLESAIARATAEEMLASLPSAEAEMRSDEVIARETIASWKDGVASVRVERVELTTGEIAYLRCWYGYDDARTTMFAAQDVLDRRAAEWREECARMDAERARQRAAQLAAEQGVLAVADDEDPS